ncbi:hypothetical protein M405DRAFT_612064 [Rhizopogon salebrosus TDB-379]|nr:hypothetical protein M405DRAFT_612064 [Rhizopogon salebrosus TDB-379]
MTANEFPAFLWSGAPARNEYNEDVMTEVLFKDYVLERVMHHFFGRGLTHDTFLVPRHSQISTLLSCSASCPFDLRCFPVHSRFHARFTSLPHSPLTLHTSDSGFHALPCVTVFKYLAMSEIAR